MKVGVEGKGREREGRKKGKRGEGERRGERERPS